MDSLAAHKLSRTLHESSMHSAYPVAFLVLVFFFHTVTMLQFCPGKDARRAPPPRGTLGTVTSPRIHRQPHASFPRTVRTQLPTVDSTPTQIIREDGAQIVRAESLRNFSGSTILAPPSLRDLDRGVTPTHAEGGCTVTSSKLRWCADTGAAYVNNGSAVWLGMRGYTHVYR